MLDIAICVERTLRSALPTRRCIRNVRCNKTPPTCEEVGLASPGHSSLGPRLRVPGQGQGLAVAAPQRPVSSRQTTLNGTPASAGDDRVAPGGRLSCPGIRLHRAPARVPLPGRDTNDRGRPAEGMPWYMHVSGWCALSMQSPGPPATGPGDPIATSCHSSPRHYAQLVESLRQLVRELHSDHALGDIALDKTARTTLVEMQSVVRGNSEASGGRARVWAMC